MKMQFAINILCIPFLVLVVLLGCSKGSETYYPLKEGMTWEYHMSMSVRSRVVSKHTKLVSTNLAPRELKGKKVTPVKCNHEGNVSLSFIAEDNNGIYGFASQGPGDVEPEIASTPEYIIKQPIQVGTTWDTESHSIIADVPVTLRATIEKVDEVVDVTAGTFNGCIMIKRTATIKKSLSAGGGGRIIANIKIEDYIWYAPGVGLVKTITKETPDDYTINLLGSVVMTTQLESFKK